MKKVVVIGGGAAGMMAAIQSAKNGNEVVLYEKNEKLGKKIFITGKGRCNLTNACDVSELFSQVISNPKFLYSAFYTFSNEDTIAFFENLGLKTKVERGNRVFPVSDKSSDVIKVLQKECEKQKVSVVLNTKVKCVLSENGKVQGVQLVTGEKIPCDIVVLATGGCSYSSTGSTGDGYDMAMKLGHNIKKVRPGLTGMLVKEDVAARLQGLTLKNISLKVTQLENKKKKLYEGFGELLFTHYGVSGPLILSASSITGDKLEKQNLCLHIDMKPALEVEQLDKRILKDFQEGMNADIKNALIHLLPKSMIPEVLLQSGIAPEEKVNQISKEQRSKLVQVIKDFTLTLTGLRDIQEAIITRGGISVSEIDPSTMESKKVKGLYVVGEVLDLDALTGGFNLQIAWSTGYLAGNQI